MRSSPARAFASDGVLEDAARTLDADGFRTHEFGDSMLVFADGRAQARGAIPRADVARAA